MALPAANLAAAEQRKSPRRPVALTGHCRLGHRFVTEPVADLSRGGLYLRTREPVREGTAVQLALALPAATGVRFLTLSGKVARRDKDARGQQQGLGVSFTENTLSAVDRIHFERFLASVH